jgi:hypothetical protein
MSLHLPAMFKLENIIGTRWVHTRVLTDQTDIAKPAQLIEFKMAALFSATL